MNLFEEEKTLEEIQESISAAYDSVNLINGIIAGTEMTEESIQERKDCVNRNTVHLVIMGKKSWFSENLTAEQSTEIETAISNGKTYVAT